MNDMYDSQASSPDRNRIICERHRGDHTALREDVRCTALGRGEGHGRHADHADIDEFSHHMIFYSWVLHRLNLHKKKWYMTDEYARYALLSPRSVQHPEYANDVMSLVHEA